MALKGEYIMYRKSTLFVTIMMWSCATLQKTPVAPLPSPPAKRKFSWKWAIIKGIIVLAASFILLNGNFSEKTIAKTGQISNEISELKRQASVKVQSDVSTKPEESPDQSRGDARPDISTKPETHTPGKLAKKPLYISISPFSSHEERYQNVFSLLVKGGMKPDRIVEIFSSKRAKETDMTPVEKMSKRVISPPSKRTEKQTYGIAKTIQRHLKKYKTDYDNLEKRYGLNREIAAAILFKETSLGAFKDWRHESFTVLNTMLGFMELPYNAGTRQKKRMERILLTAEKSLAGLLLYCEKYHIDITDKRFPSSFAGALGTPQFLPMYMDYAITTDNTVPDLSKIPDAIFSLGNIMKNRFDWPGLMKLDRLRPIDTIIEKYTIYDKQKDVSFCMSVHLDGYALRRFIDEDEFSDIPHLDYIGRYAKSLMNYNFSSVYTLDVFQFAYYTHKLRTGR